MDFDEVSPEKMAEKRVVQEAVRGQEAAKRETLWNADLNICSQTKIVSLLKSASSTATSSDGTNPHTLILFLSFLSWMVIEINLELYNF